MTTRFKQIIKKNLIFFLPFWLNPNYYKVRNKIKHFFNKTQIRFTSYNQQLLLKNIISLIPNSISKIHFHRTNEGIKLLDHAYTEKNNVYVKLKNNIILKTFPSRQIYNNTYFIFKGFIKKLNDFKPIHHQAIADIKSRYLKGFENLEGISTKFFNGRKNLTIIECGAYNGWKTLGYFKYLDQSSKVISIEVDPDQFDLLDWNLKKNIEPDRFINCQKAIWSEENIKKRISYGHYASHTLLTPDEHAAVNQNFYEVNTTTLKTIIDQSQYSTIDFINIQTNGSELESLKGLQGAFDKVKLIYLGTHYKINGVSIRYLVGQYAKENGFSIFELDGSKLNYADINKNDVGGIFLQIN